MLSAFRHCLQPPEFPGDASKTRVASTLNAVLLMGLGGSLVYIMFILMVARGELKSLAFSIFPIVFLLGLRYILSRGAVHLASVLLVLLSWLNLTIAAIAGGDGIRASSLYGYILIVIVAGLLISWRASVLIAMANVASGLFMIYAESNGLLPQRTVTETSFTIWSASAVFSVSAAFILGIALHSIQDAFRRAAINESYHRMLFEEAPDGILIVNENNRVVMANTAIYQMTGYSPKEVIGRSPLDFVAPEDLAKRPSRPFDEIKVPGAMKHERVLAHKDGSRLSVIISSSYMPDGHLQYIIQDVTQRKQMEEALRASEEKFAKSFQFSPDAVTISFVDTGEFIEVNDGFCRMSGYTREEALGHSAEELNIWEDLNRRSEMISILQSEGKVRDFETTLRRRTGELLNCLLTVEAVIIGGKNCMVALTRDVTQQKQMELELRLSAERYRLVSSVISDYIYSTRRDENGHWHQNWVAGAFERITGHTLKEFNARGGWRSIVHPDDLRADTDAMNKLLNGEKTVSEIRIIHKDNSVRWVRSYAHPVWDKKQNRLVEIYGAVQDITERKHMEEALRISEEKFAKSFQASPETVAISLIDTGKILEVNDSFLKMFGYSRQECIGRTAQELNIWVDMNERQKMLEILQRQGKVRDFAVLAKRKSGELANVLVSAEVIEVGDVKCMVVMSRDVTESKRMEEELRLSEERYRLVSSVISDYTFSNVQNEKGEIVLTWVAGAFEQISGYTFEEFNARGGWVSTVHPEDLEQDARDMEKLRCNQKVISEIRTIHKDGTIRWVRSYAHPVWDEEKNELVGIYGAVQDITDRKRVENEREKLIKDLEAKNEELEQFTYTVSHDLKAPLITIKGFLGFLGADARSGDIQRAEADIQRINEAADKMHDLLTDLLELSRIGRMMNAPERISFEKLLQEVIELSEGRLRERGIEVLVNHELPVVYGDRQRLFEVVQNLVDNASKFMDSQQPQPLIEIGQLDEKANGFATLYVRDNGIGIAPEYHERIFGLFNRLNPKIEGTGIGLALVKRIIEVHGGRIWVQSEAGSGATFYFTLPVVPLT